MDLDMFRHFLIGLFFSLPFSCFGMTAYSVADTLVVSSEHALHVVFPSAVTDIEVSNPDLVYVRQSDNNPNMVGLLAFEPFDAVTSVFFVDSDRKSYSYYIRFSEDLPELVRNVVPMVQGGIRPGVAEGEKSVEAYEDIPGMGPLSAEAGAFKRGEIGHVGLRKYKVTVVCDRLYVDGDKIFFRFHIKNRSGISYEFDDVACFVESPDRNSAKRRRVRNSEDRSPIQLEVVSNTGPGEDTYSTFVFEKFTLRPGEVFIVGFNEKAGTGTRDFLMEFNSDDINRMVMK